jgi:putative hydrolase of the HAD superfamily
MLIKNIVFDLGGVILDIDPMVTVRNFEELGFRNFIGSYNFPNQSPLFDAIEVGKITDSEFRDGLRLLFGSDAEDGAIDAAWNAMLLRMPPLRIKILEQLASHYRIFLLSNTNCIHIRALGDLLECSVGFRDFGHLFEKVYYSFEIGMRKPMVEIFDYVLTDRNLMGCETLFIDDAESNLIGAAKAGLHTLHLHISDEEMADLFTDGGLNSRAWEKIS